MDAKGLDRLLEGVRSGAVSLAEARNRLAAVLPGGHDGNGVAHLDHHRALRCGFPEVVLGSAKEPDDLIAICREIVSRSPSLLVTRVSPATADRVQAALPAVQYHARARALTVLADEPETRRAGVWIVTAGTGDVPVAEEARVTAWAMGEAPEVRYDVGVAGLHRILGEVDRLRQARVVVVAAGMDGALPSVVGGLVSVPVIAVPTSVGYGMALEGVAPLLTMLNACAPNVCVVNVDNGFGAGYLASLISRSADGAPEPADPGSG